MDTCSFFMGPEMVINTCDKKKLNPVNQKKKGGLGLFFLVLEPQFFLSPLKMTKNWAKKPCFPLVTSKKKPKNLIFPGG